MATNYPGSLDTATQQPAPSSTTDLDAAGYLHDVVHTNHSGAIIALETKLGSTDSNPVAGAVLMGTGSGTSAWDTTPTFTDNVIMGSDDDITSFTGTTVGTLKINNDQYDADDYTCLDFGYSGSANPIGRIGLKITGSGSQLHFGTSNNYSNGITNTAMVISQTGNVSIEDGNLTLAHDSSDSNISLGGAGTGYTHASIRLSATGDARGTGTYGFNAYNDTTWYWGNPYAYEDSWRVCRKSSTTSLAADTAHGGTYKLLQLMDDGDMTIQGTLTESSDSRLKTEIADSSLGLDFVNALKPREYRRVDGVRKHYGFIAQEVAAVLPDASDNAIWVNDQENVAAIGEEENIVSTQGLRYTHLIAPLVKAVQELTARIETLEG